MKLVAVSQRVDIIHDYDERRDSLDQRWADLLSACNLSPLLIPNNKSSAEKILANTPLLLNQIIFGRRLQREAIARNRTDRYASVKFAMLLYFLHCSEHGLEL